MKTDKESIPSPAQVRVRSQGTVSSTASASTVRESAASGFE